MCPNRDDSETDIAPWPAESSIVGGLGSEMTMHQRLVSLAAFLPVFTAPGFEFGRWPETDRASPFIPFDFSPQAEELLDACYHSGWIQVFDWMSWVGSSEAQSLRTDLGGLNKATPEQLSRLLTSLIRGERFCDGTLDSAFRSGLLVGILRRASALAKPEHRDGDVA